MKKCIVVYLNLINGILTQIDEIVVPENYTESDYIHDILSKCNQPDDLDCRGEIIFAESKESIYDE